MAQLAPGTHVELREGVTTKLSFPPPALATLTVCVHEGALKAARSGLTLVAGLVDGSVAWVGALDEELLGELTGHTEHARALVREKLLTGGRLWEVVRPGLLVQPGVSRPLLTVYDGDRPWVAVGALETGSLLAAPLNDASGTQKWWTPRLEESQLGFLNSKASHVELSHLWSFEGSVASVGALTTDGSDIVGGAIEQYFSETA